MHLIFPFPTIFTKLLKRHCQNKREDLDEAQVKVQLVELKEFGMRLII